MKRELKGPAWGPSSCAPLMQESHEERIERSSAPPRGGPPPSNLMKRELKGPLADAVAGSVMVANLMKRELKVTSCEQELI